MYKKLLVLTVAVFAAMSFSPAPPSSDDEIFLYRAVAKQDANHFPLNQGSYGSCVAFGHAAGCDILLAQDYIAGKASKVVWASPDSIYGGSRNEAYDKIRHSRSQGSNGYGATTWLAKRGGVLYQQVYEIDGQTIDLTKYSIPRTADWGYWGNGGQRDGVGGPVDREAAKHPLGGVALVRTLEELDIALKNGYPVTICSGQGFSRTRDKDGFCYPSGSWAHCMCIVGKRNGGRKGYLILNSWGNYVQGGKYKDQPDGSFYAEPQVVLRILRQGDSWALSKQSGFPRKVLPFWMLSADASWSDAPEPQVDGRNEKVYFKDGFWRFDENGKQYYFKGGEWWECSSGQCRRCKYAIREEDFYSLMA